MQSLQQWLYWLKLRSRSLFGQARVERDLDDEIAFHIAMQAKANREAGMPASEAELAAHRQFGGGNEQKEACRDYIFGWMEGFMQWHLKTAAKAVLRHRKTSLAAAGILSIGIGMSVAMFSLLDAVLLRPLPFPRQQSIEVIWKVDARAGRYVEEMAYPSCVICRKTSAISNMSPSCQPRYTAMPGCCRSRTRADSD